MLARDGVAKWLEYTEGSCSIPGQGHIPGLPVRSLPLVKEHVGGNQSMFLSPRPPTPSPYLPSTLKKKYPQGGLTNKNKCHHLSFKENNIVC